MIPAPAPSAAGSLAGMSAARFDLPAVPGSAAAARYHARDMLLWWDRAGLVADAQAVATELVSNAVSAAIRAGGGHPVLFTLHCRPLEPRIYVWDHGPGQPCQQAAGADEESGRGLAIVDSLTGGRWGWYPTPASGGKVIWGALEALLQPTQHSAGSTLTRRRGGQPLVG